MARIRITTSASSGGMFTGGGGGVSADIRLDEDSWEAGDFNTVLGGLTVSATTIFAALNGTDDVPVMPTMITVPDDQVQAVSDLNSGTDHPGGLLIIPASARRINFPSEDDWNEAPLNPDEPAPDLDPEQHFGNEDEEARA